MADVDRMLAAAAQRAGGPADFTFNVTEGQFTGTLGKQAFYSSAYSGGRGGTTVKGAALYFLVNNPFSTGVKKPDPSPDNIVGGTLPLGRYGMRTHEKKPNHIRLTPLPGTLSLGRDGMLIHGSGKRGSDGCIALHDSHVVEALYAALKKQEESGEDAPILEVVAIGSDPDRKLREWRTTA